MLSLSSPHLCQWHQRAANQEDLDSNCTSALNSLGCLKQVGLILSLSLPVCNMSENAVGLHSRVVVRIIIMHVKQFEHLNYIGRCGGYTGVLRAWSCANAPFCTSVSTPSFARASMSSFASRSITVSLLSWSTCTLRFMQCFRATFGW